MESIHYTMKNTHSSSIFALTASSALLLLLCGRVVYLLYFHPLHPFPGPLLWRILGAFSDHCIYTGKAAQKYKLLHRKYGPVVRVAPDELSFADPQAWKDVHGARSPEFPKHMMRQALPPNGHYSITMSPKEEHARFRRLLSHAFSEHGLREQQPKITAYTQLMVERLIEVAQSGSSANLAEWFTITAFDLIGDLAWGESFHGLQNRRMHEWIPAVNANLKFIIQGGVLKKRGLGWFTKYLVDEHTTDLRRQNYALSTQMAEKRAAYQDGPRGDFWDHVLIKSANDNAAGEGMTKEEMTNNASVLILAGADTTATTLSGVVYMLLKHPDVLSRLTQEIRTSFKSSIDINLPSINNLSYLLAVLDEGMRLYPAVPNGVTRVVPTGGRMICGKWIPAGTAIQVPQSAMHNYGGNFHRPDEFLPQRWLPDAPSEFSQDKKAAFQPFSVGSRNCIGRHLAYAEMRLILTKVLFHFDLEFDGERMMGNWLDQTAFVTWNTPPLWVKLKAIVPDGKTTE